jgi:hypothetical protein
MGQQKSTLKENMENVENFEKNEKMENFENIEKVKVLFLIEAKLNKDHPLALIVNNKDIFDNIFKLLIRFCKLECIVKGPNAYQEFEWNWEYEPIVFPPFTGININMMPIILGNFYNNTSLPDYIKPYDKIILSCVHQQYGSLPTEKWNNNKWIGYLTIHESIVEPGETQRRPGLHIESPLGKGDFIPRPIKNFDEDYYNSEWFSIEWGGGNYHKDKHRDGIYIVSNTDDMTAIYPYLVENSEKVTDKYGGLQEFKNDLTDKIFTKKNKVYWITDKTPHESLPNNTDKPVYRQFVRIVVGPIGAWYSQHNTPNPLGIKPDAPVIDTNKFTLR